MNLMTKGSQKFPISFVANAPFSYNLKERCACLQKYKDFFQTLIIAFLHITLDTLIHFFSLLH